MSVKPSCENCQHEPELGSVSLNPVVAESSITFPPLGILVQQIR
jgi:hypothetical protein